MDELTGATARALWVPDPGWDCGLAAGVPPPELGEPVFQVALETDAPLCVGRTHLGRRRVIPSRGGAITGARLSGQVDPGGLGFELVLENGAHEVEEVHVLRTGGDEVVYLRTAGIAPNAHTPSRFIAHLEARADGPDRWLGETLLVGLRERRGDRTVLSFYAFARGTPSGLECVTVTRPAGAPGAAWDPPPVPAEPGPLAITEAVSIGALIRVGAVPGGTRTVIPITGGSFQGSGMAGEVLPFGADYQVWAQSGPTLDARYLLRTEDGELIVVRNIGPPNALTPHLETRADGPHAWLNNTRFTSRLHLDPGQVTVRIHHPL